MFSHATSLGPESLVALRRAIEEDARALGFSAIGVSDLDVGEAHERLVDWIGSGRHGEMHYMAAHLDMRAEPERLVPGTVRVLCARMDYVPETIGAAFAHQWQRMSEPGEAVVSLYAHGRDYHKVVRRRLDALAMKLQERLGPMGYRAFTDSAPVMEVELARKAGLGWRGKHTLLLSRSAGSMFFLGEVFVDVPIPVDEPTSDHCGRCRRCIDICPTQAIVAPYELDARRCISYLTIEHKGSIDPSLRPLIGNRIYGCDDCQLVCPWNKFAQPSAVGDFKARPVSSLSLIEAFGWTEVEFLKNTEGSAIRRIGYIQWLRNVAVALGNALNAASGEALKNELRTALRTRLEHPAELVREHTQWALLQGGSRQ